MRLWQMNDWGCLAQAFYLAATALQLAPSAFGGTQAFLFEEITGIPVNDEPQVGMFVLSKQAETQSLEPIQMRDSEL